MRDRLVENNQQIRWVPGHIRDGRFGEWLDGNVDWALSRERYWGTPLPFWACTGCRRTDCIGSFEELAERGGLDGPPEDPHRPYIDEVTLDCPDCPGEMRRTPEVADAWFDSGAMPYAQWHYPFENGDDLRCALPRRLHLRGRRPDARLVLHAARPRHAAQRRRGRARGRRLPQRDQRRPDRGRRGPEDVQVARQRRRPVGSDRRPRGGRAALVHVRRRAARQLPPLLLGAGRRGLAARALDALEHLLVLRHLREHRGVRSGGCAARGRAHGAGSLGALRAALHDPQGHGRPRRLRAARGRAPDRRADRRAVELVRAAQPGGASGSPTTRRTRRRRCTRSTSA